MRYGGPCIFVVCAVDHDHFFSSSGAFCCFQQLRRFAYFCVDGVMTTQQLEATCQVVNDALWND